MRRLRDTNTRIIGCFHSHPNGDPSPSATDRAEAYESGFVYLIAAGAGDVLELKAYLFEESRGFGPLTLAADQ